MSEQIRFGDFLHKVTVRYDQVSYRHRPPKFTIRPIDIYKILSPYISIRFMDQFKAVFPLALYMCGLQWLILGRPVTDAARVGAGLFAVIVGLMLFMEGLKLGLMPLGEIIGSTLPRKTTLWVVLLVIFILGIGVTLAEPAIGALQTAGSIVDVRKAPYLFTLLNDKTSWIILAIGAGVGSAAILGTLRLIYGWSLKPLIYASLLPTMVITVYASWRYPGLNRIAGLAWDCGAVTTGPVTVPIVLALGIGVANAVGKGDSSLSGFGIVTLASIFPILAVLLLCIITAHMATPEVIIEAAGRLAAGSSRQTLGWYEQTPWLETITGLRAVLPLVIFLFFILSIVLKEKLKHAGLIRYGIILSIVGMIVFNLGLTYGLAEMGDRSGGLIPGSFAEIAEMENSPVFGYTTGIAVALLAIFILGFGATLAEPALNALGITVENLTNGAFRKSLLMYSVSGGVAMGLACGALKIIFDIPLVAILLPGYALALVLTWFSTEEFVNVAWDSAGVTTGPVTVPLVLALGLGFGKTLGVVEGFGMLACASMFPVLSVLFSGLYIQAKLYYHTRDRFLEEST
ncbi:MAG: DUF1538 domain-containing protein [Lentisphaerae bacterium]|nr:DUF1538 domain-containing protein [Lentisphaerota bacterium]